MLDISYLNECKVYFDSVEFGFFDPIPKENDIMKFVEFSERFNADIDCISLFTRFTNDSLVMVGDGRIIENDKAFKINGFDINLNFVYSNHDEEDTVAFSTGYLEEFYFTYISAKKFQENFNRKISQICESIVELYFKRSYDNVKTLNTNRRVGILIKDLIEMYKKVNPHAETVDKSIQYVALTLQLYETFYGCPVAGISSKRPEKVKEEPNENFYSLPRRRGRAMPRKED